MFRATMCSSSGGQLYEYDFWYNHFMLVAVWYAVQDGTIPVPSWPAYLRMSTYLLETCRRFK